MTVETMERPVTFIMGKDQIAKMMEALPAPHMCVCHTCGKIGLLEGRIRWQPHCICCYHGVKR